MSDRPIRRAQIGKLFDDFDPRVPRNIYLQNMPPCPTPWSEAALSIWGKTNRSAQTWMPVVQHLCDSAAVAGWLWDNWLTANVKSLLGDAFPDGEADARIVVQTLAGLHDIGKATPAFAAQAQRSADTGGLVTAMERQGLSVGPVRQGTPPHGRLGQVIFEAWLGNVGDASTSQRARARWATALGVVIGGHHGIPPTADELAAVTWQDLGASDTWREVRLEIITRIAQHTGFSERIPAMLHLPAPRQNIQMLLTAVVVIADWLASDDERFPHDMHHDTQRRLDLANLAGDLPPPWQTFSSETDPNSLLQQRFPHLSGSLRPVQDVALSLASKMPEPALMLIEAPMGEGKTEAALLAAESLANRFGMGGVFIGLPTMATSDAMFGRALAWANQLPLSAPTSMTLAHSKAALNDNYDALRRKRFQGIGEFGVNQDNVYAASWLTGRRKGVLTSIVVGTIDQALFTALAARHVALRHLAMASKVVVIDEVHAADIYMRVYLHKTLEWLAAYRVPVILLSATLPPQQRRALLAAYAAGRQHTSTDADSTEYPVVTVQGEATQSVGIQGAGRTLQIHVELGGDDAAQLRALLEPVLVDGGNAVVIRNTVKRAQTTYDELVGAFGPERVTLLHSRFIAVDRLGKEAALRAAFGPPGSGSQRAHGQIVVGTQVLEQSLDVDFDVMVTDIAPVDLILQRAGRLHRHDRGPRARTFAVPRLILAGVRETLAAPRFDPGAVAIYGEDLLLRAVSTLRPQIYGGEPIHLPADIPVLVRAAYATDHPCPPGWESRWLDAHTDAERRQLESQLRAQTFCLRDPWTEPSLVGLLRARTEDGDATSLAQVRDTEDSVEVLAVQRVGRELRSIPTVFGQQLDLGDPELGPPTSTTARHLGRFSLRLPAHLSRSARGDLTLRDLEDQSRILTSWQDSPWLKGELPLIFDEQLTVEVGGFVLRYDSERGLTDEKVSS